MKVSVLTISYNIEKFIAEAINSALMQELSSDYEIVIGEDCSADKTREIVIDYQRKYTDKIRLFLNEKNMGMARNFANTFDRCKGEYIALLDGDDYWISPYKLQKQTNFLDNHPECAICFHDVRIFYEDSDEKPHTMNPPIQRPFLTMEDLLSRGCFIYSCSAMIRRDMFNGFPEWYFANGGKCDGDWAFYILVSQHGKIGYIDEVMSAYRVHKGGVWSGLNEIEQIEGVIDFYKAMNANLNFKYNKIINTMISKYYYELAFAQKKNGNIAKAMKYLFKCFITDPFNKLIPFQNLTKF